MRQSTILVTSNNIHDSTGDFKSKLASRQGLISGLISVAPMMDWTDKHDRYFLRLISPHVVLYTEMIVASALKYRNRDKLLSYNHFEKPLVLQLGGCCPVDLRLGAQLAEEYGFSEVNLNVGCPSDRVQAGKFGACLMLEPNLVADCIEAMNKSVGIPVTVKCRIGVDQKDSFEDLVHFIQTIANTGCNTFIMHARKAWLKGLSPKENRTIPPLQYDVVARIKKTFPQLRIIMNGGIKSICEIDQHLQVTDGVMIGREAYTNPYFLAEIEKHYYNTEPLSREEVIEKLMPYIQTQLNMKIKLSHITRHILGLFHGEPGGRIWRQMLSSNASMDAHIIYDALRVMKEKCNARFFL